MEKGLRKGPWSQQEDAILIEYVKRHGPKNWNAMQRVTGLPRDGKSCRLRWLNHLDPDLRKGKLSEVEKQKILQLRQLKIKWCDIAQQIPGRTDNEIKNFYNINERKKRKIENGNGKCQKKNKKINVASTSNIPIMQPSDMQCNNVASTSTKNNSSPTIIDRGEAPFMPADMVSNVPLFLEFQSFESPLHPYTSISDKPSPTFIDRSETYFISKDMESNLPLLPESMDFESFESLIQKYPPLPLRSSEEIQQEQLELDSPFNNNLLESMSNTSNILDDSNGNLYSCETRLVDENGKKPTYLRKDESNCETRLVDENGSKPIYLKKDESNCETRLIDENGMKPTSLKKDESNCETRLIDENGMKPTSNNEDLIDVLDSLGWFDGYIFDE